MWSKASRFVEGIHTIGDILTKISVNCVFIYMLHYYLCVIFMGVSCLCYMYMFTIIQYESVHLQNVFVYLNYIYNFS
jgi:hypothetical protein